MDVPDLPKESIERLRKLLKSWNLEFLLEQFIGKYLVVFCVFFVLFFLCAIIV